MSPTADRLIVRTGSPLSTTVQKKLCHHGDNNDHAGCNTDGLPRAIVHIVIGRPRRGLGLSRRGLLEIAQTSLGQRQVLFNAGAQCPGLFAARIGHLL